MRTFSVNGPGAAATESADAAAASAANASIVPLFIYASFCSVFLRNHGRCSRAHGVARPHRRVLYQKSRRRAPYPPPHSCKLKPRRSPHNCRRLSTWQCGDCPLGCGGGGGNDATATDRHIAAPGRSAAPLRRGRSCVRPFRLLADQGLSRRIQGKSPKPTPPRFCAHYEKCRPESYTATGKGPHKRQPKCFATCPLRG